MRRRRSSSFSSGYSTWNGRASSAGAMDVAISPPFSNTSGHSPATGSPRESARMPMLCGKAAVEALGGTGHALRARQHVHGQALRVEQLLGVGGGEQALQLLGGRIEDQVGDEGRPPRLVGGAQAGAVVAVEVLVEDQVVPGGIALQHLG